MQGYLGWWKWPIRFRFLALLQHHWSPPRARAVCEPLALRTAMVQHEYGSFLCKVVDGTFFLPMQLRFLRCLVSSSHKMFPKTTTMPL